MKRNKKLVALICTVLLLVGAAGATLAWLTAQSGPVNNTFTTSDINIELNENTGLEYKMIPGHFVTKDPAAKVLSGSEKCYLFVEIQEKGVEGTVTNSDGTTKAVSYTFRDFMNYTVAEPWELVPNTTNVYYIEVDTDAEINVAFPILTGNKVNVNTSVTKGMMEDLNALQAAAGEGETELPTLTFEAFATQLYKNNTDKFSVTDAWAEAQKLK